MENNIFGKSEKSNILSTTLNLLNVKHTSTYTNKHYNEHPNKYDMFGLSKMLSHFGVQSLGIRIAEKEDSIWQLELPFIAHVGYDFVIVEKVSKENITYHWREERLSVPIKEFINIWSGVTLLFETDDNSIEPNYNKNKNLESIIDIQKILLFLSCFLLLGITIIHNQIYLNLGHSIMMILNLIGIYIGYLLVLKQMKIKSNNADKICSLFSKSKCNDILDSPASKLIGVVGWSELGLSYFLSNLFILLIIPHLFLYSIFLNICILPYSFWSIWYQKFKAKTWCPLCLIVQVLFWGLFVTSLLIGFVKIPQFTLLDIISVGLIYIMPILLINLILPKLAEGGNVERIKQMFNSIRMNDKYFDVQLKGQAFYNVDKNLSNILLGNPNAEDFITIFTNPHCEPCARMHTRIENFLKVSKDRFCIQYMLSSFDEELDSSNEFFIWINKNYSSEERDTIYTKWFTEGKYDKENFFMQYDFTQCEVSEEHRKHKEWRAQTKFNATPTILINGWLIPDNYSLEDLLYLSI